MKRRNLMFNALAAALLSGCATGNKGNFLPAQPLVQVIPPQGREEARVVANPDKPEPIYINPVIEEVEMAGYVNDEGNLVFPGKILVISQPGRWNLAAAQKDRQYFVPADNQAPQLAPPSKSYYDYIQSKRNGHVTARLDVSKVRVLGYAQKEDQARAQRQLLPGETAAFDPNLGWLGIPASGENVEELPPPVITPPDVKLPETENTGQIQPPPVNEEELRKQLEQLAKEAAPKSAAGNKP